MASLLATVYSVWRERNNALWNQNVHTIDVPVKDIQSTVKHRVKARLPRRMIDKDIQWLYSL